MYSRFFKRLIDIIFSLLSLILVLPLLLIIILLIKIKLGSPIFFKQNRPGKNEKIFIIYKFRTMMNTHDEFGKLLSDEERLTKFGKILRSTSLDELPELINILKGDMSFVGPRPLLVEYLPKYDQEQKQRHLVRPGLTGLAQVSGRNQISWNDRFKLDLQYIERITFLQDIKIIILTVWKVINRSGINSKTTATMEVFEGNAKQISNY